MIRHLLRAGLIAALLAAVSGCSDRMDLENVTNNFSLGIDLTPDKHVIFYMSSPVYSKSAKKKTLERSVVVDTIREARSKMEEQSAGTIVGKKVLTILIGKRILEREDWFPLLDVFFRDTKNQLTPRMIAVDGPVSKIVFFNPKDQPYTPMLLRGMVDTKSARSETVATTLLELRRQMSDTGLTPCMSEITLDKRKEIRLKGTALLDNKGKYVLSLNTAETRLLRMLQKEAKAPVAMTVTIPGAPLEDPFSTNKLSFDASRIKTNIKTSYSGNKFHYDIKVRMFIGIRERMFPFDVRKNEKKLEALITKQLEQRFERLIKKIQARKIDPIGLGLYARANSFAEFEKVAQNWGAELAKADIRVAVKVTIKDTGPMK